LVRSRSTRPRELLAAPARYAVVHLDFEAEERVARLARGLPDRARPHPRHWSRLRADAARIRARLRAAWGPPDLQGDGIVVWDLARIRAEEGPADPDASPS